MKKINTKLTLVGAGPGSADLITVRGLRALQNADVVLYDALANDELLDEAPDDAVKIYVGKRANQHRYSQEMINMLCVQYAYSHGQVVRLKGGDPFVFGRGHEEMTFAKKHGVRVEVVPGISSSISLPELQEVPVTRRGVNESFWVLTGTTKAGKLSNDIQLAAQSSATVIILMGIRKLPQIVELFQQANKGETAVMIIQNGSLPNEKKVLGTIDTIEIEAALANIGSPGIIVIGEVVRLHPEMVEAATMAQAA
ncbi:MAG: uroporphyrinogen-III C-methyltransferase [Saprospiraceae bacterium]